MVAATLIAQQVPFNPIFLVSDPAQKWRLLANFLLYLMPFLAGAFFLGTVFLKSREAFGRVYFADLTGSGLAGLVVLGAHVPLHAGVDRRRPAPPVGARRRAVVRSASAAARGPCRCCSSSRFSRIARLCLSCRASLGIPTIAVSQYKGVAYARNFPDAERIYRSVSPFGDLQVYSKLLHAFRAGPLRQRRLQPPRPPANTYVGMYIDGDGPEGIMRTLGGDGARLFPLPADVLSLRRSRTKPDTFVVQFGGGISTMAALGAGRRARHGRREQSGGARRLPTTRRSAISPATSSPTRQVTRHRLRRPALPRPHRRALRRHRPQPRRLGRPLQSRRLRHRREVPVHARGDARATCARSPTGGVLSVTLWNKEEPPKSVLKLYATMAEAARDFDPAIAANAFFVASSYLSTTTVLYKRGGFTAGRGRQAPQLYRARCRSTRSTRPASPSIASRGRRRCSTNIGSRSSAAARRRVRPAASVPADAGRPATDAAADHRRSRRGRRRRTTAPLPSTTLARLAWQSLIDRRLRRRSRGATSSTRGRSPTTGPISPPM